MDNSSLALIICALFAFLSVLYMMYRLSKFSKKRSLYLIVVFVSWFLVIYSLCLIPLDVSSTMHRQCLADNVSNPCKMPINYVHHDTFDVIWRSVYWILQTLTLIIIPVIKILRCNAYFTIGGKIKSIFIRNAVFYSLYLLIFVVLLIYMLSVPDRERITFSSIRTLVATTSNTYGMLWVIVLLGYGLVDVPRYFWLRSHYRREYDRTLFEIATVSDELRMTNDRIKNNLTQINTALEEVPRDTKGRGYLDIIISKLPQCERVKINPKTAVASGGRLNAPADVRPSYMKLRNLLFNLLGVEIGVDLDTYIDYGKTNNLVLLHYSVINNVLSRKRCSGLIDYLVDRALFLEDIITCEKSEDRCFKRCIRVEYSWFSRSWLPYAEWIWYVKMKPLALKLIAVMCGVFSCITLFSEVTFFSTTPVLSLFALALKLSYRLPTPWVFTEAVGYLTLLYMCMCTYSSVFRIRFYNIIRVVGRHTDVYCLLMCSGILCFLVSPICLNFLSLIHLDKGTLFKKNQVLETSFSSTMGQLKILPFISEYFNIYYPMSMALVCLFSIFNVASRVLSCFGELQFIVVSEFSNEILTDGKIILQQEKRKKTMNNLGLPPQRGYDTANEGGMLINFASDESVFNTANP